MKASIIFAWAFLCMAGSAMLWNYSNTPGHVARVPQQWPSDTSLVLSTKQDTLLMFDHPRCPCSRASVGELAELMAHCGGRVTAQALFYRPNDLSNGWEQTELWRDAAQIPGVETLSDIDGAEARRFGVETSGHVLLYDPRGRLLFSGGITASRGHSGDNAGKAAILAAVDASKTGHDADATLVFGCSLFGRQTNCRKGTQP